MRARADGLAQGLPPLQCIARSLFRQARTRAAVRSTSLGASRVGGSRHELPRRVPATWRSWPHRRRVSPRRRTRALRRPQGERATAARDPSPRCDPATKVRVRAPTPERRGSARRTPRARAGRAAIERHGRRRMLADGAHRPARQSRHVRARQRGDGGGSAERRATPRAERAQVPGESERGCWRPTVGSADAHADRARRLRAPREVERAPRHGAQHFSMTRRRRRAARSGAHRCEEASTLA